MSASVRRFSRRLLGLGLLAGLLGLWLSGAAGAQAQTGGWRAPVEISQPPLPEGVAAGPDERRYGSSWFADLAIGPEGSNHITWYSGISLGGESSSSLDLLMYREQRDGRWTPINEVAAPGTGGYTVRNSLAMGRDGKLHAIYRAGTVLLYTSAPWEEAASARAWSAPVLLADGSTYYNALAADNAGGLHALWSEMVMDDPLTPNKLCPNCSDLFYRRSLDGGASWEPAQNLSRSLEGEGRPQMRVDGRNRIHVAWDEGADWYAGAGLPKAGVYRRSDDGGATWSEPVYFRLPAEVAAAIASQRAEEEAEAQSPTPTPDPNKLPEYLDAVQQTALAVDNAGNPAVVFRGVENDRLYLQRSLDGGDTWEPPAEIPGVLARNLSDNNLDIYALAADGADNLHLLMVGFDARTFNPFEPTNPSLLYLSFDGTWSEPEAVIVNELYPEYPRLQVYNGNQLRAVWFTRSRDDLFNSERARYRVWYSERAVDAPAVPPLPQFTPVPTAASTPTPLPPTPTLAPTPLPAAALAAPPMNGPPDWEGRGLITILLALLPPAAIVGAVVAFRALRRP